MGTNTEISWQSTEAVSFADAGDLIAVVKILCETEISATERGVICHFGNMQVEQSK